MLGQISHLTAVLGVRAAGDKSNLAGCIRELTRQNLAVVLIKPDSKLPFCPLSSRAVSNADKEARESAILNGHSNSDRVKHACGISHAITSPEDVNKYLNHAEKLYGTDKLNIGIEVGRSNLIVVDVDTSVEKEAFLADWSRESGTDESSRSPTVASPGVYAEEEWRHKNGGHYWFTLPAGIHLPAGPGAYKAPSGWSAFFRDRQVLVPPSTRPEGPYQLVGEVLEAPAWLIGLIFLNAEDRKSRARTRLDSIGESDIDVWAAKTPWDDILLPDGWTNTGTLDNCSCAIWTAPGLHASPKSATAHDLGCSRYDDSRGHCPLHIWTDNPPEWLLHAGVGDSKTLTKLQYIAAGHYGGSIGAAIAGLGLGKDAIAVVTQEFRTTTGNVPAPASLFTPEPASNPVTTLRERLIDHMDLNSIIKPSYLIENFLNLNSLARLVGKSNDGKSFIGLDIASCVAAGKDWHGNSVSQGNVLYVAAEGSGGLENRMNAWKSKYTSDIAREALTFLPLAIQAVNAPEWAVFVEAVKDMNLSLVILDTQARISVGVDENAAQDMGVLIARLDALREVTGACVLLIHHLGHEGEHGRGSSAVYGALDTEIRISKTRNIITVFTSKQKDMEFADLLRLELTPWEQSAVITSDHTDLLSIQGIVNNTSPAADRLAKIIVESFDPDVGGTAAQLKTLALAHPTLSIGKTSFYRIWGEMVKTEELEVRSPKNVTKSGVRYYPSAEVLRRIEDA